MGQLEATFGFLAHGGHFIYYKDEFHKFMEFPCIIADHPILESATRTFKYRMMKKNPMSYK